MKERIYQTTIIVLTVMLFSVWQAYAGNPTGPGTPPASTSSYTLSDIYNRLHDGTAGSQSNFTEPSVAPGTGTMHTLNEIMAKAPMTDTNGAIAAEVADGKTVWGLTSGEWGVITGTASLGGGSASVPDTGQTTCYDPTDTDTPIATIPCIGSGQDGAYTNTVGVDWPNPRFTVGGDDNGNGTCDPSETCDGTVTDNLTGLIWLKDANCFGTQNWATALNSAKNLASGSCSLLDGSIAGDWRLPNVLELQSLIDYGQSNPALPSGHPFTGVQTGNYWSSSTYTGFPADGWYVGLYNGGVEANDKEDPRSVWLVKGGE